MRYLPHTEAEVRAMLARIGVSSVDALFEDIPPGFRLERALDLEPSLPEPRLMAHLGELAQKSTGATKRSFLGAGIYDHHIPPAVDQLLLRSEFYTAYTPYQPEYAQGTLQAIFEFQTMVCQLLGMEVANASMYDGASAAAEAVLMARRVTRKEHVVVSGALHPEYLETIRTYLSGLQDESALTVVPFDPEGGRTLAADIQAALRDDTAAVVLGYPNFLGVVENLGEVHRLLEGKDTLLVTATAEPYALSLLKPPGEQGADIAVAEGQALAVPPQLGGPGVGLFACAKRFVHKMPGRLVGETVDTTGQRGYVLTLSTREQHIRRERATSNICTNHGLIALSMTIRTALLGRRGFREVGETCLRQAEYLKAKIGALPNWSLATSGATFNEFAVRHASRDVADIVAELGTEGLLAGVPMGRFFPDQSRDLLIAVTEKHDVTDLDALISALARF